jgi:hypothetical protein
MSKVIRLTESDLVRLVKKVLNEQSGGNPLTFSQVVDVPNTTKDQLFDLIMEWLTTRYKNPKSVVQLSNKEQGLIVLKGAHSWAQPKGFGAGGAFDGWINHTIKIQVKDNKFKIEIFDFNHESKHPEGNRFTLGFLTDREIYGDKPKYSLYHNKAWPMMKDQSKKFFDDTVNLMKSEIQAFKRDDDFQP